MRPGSVFSKPFTRTFFVLVFQIWKLECLANQKLYYIQMSLGVEISVGPRFFHGRVRFIPYSCILHLKACNHLDEDQ